MHQNYSIRSHWWVTFCCMNCIKMSNSRYTPVKSCTIFLLSSRDPVTLVSIFTGTLQHYLSHYINYSKTTKTTYCFIDVSASCLKPSSGLTSSAGRQYVKACHVAQLPALSASRRITLAFTLGDKRIKKASQKKELKSRGMVTIPYVKGLSEAFSRILKTYRICTAVKPHTMLRNL